MGRKRRYWQNCKLKRTGYGFGQGYQIFATKDTIDALAGADLAISSAGTFQLKGFNEEREIYEVS